MPLEVCKPLAADINMILGDKLMSKVIINTKLSDYQLVSLGIELVHKVLSIVDCNVELLNNPHIAKANELAQKWNNIFMDKYIPTKEGSL